MNGVLGTFLVALTSQEPVHSGVVWNLVLAGGSQSVTDKVRKSFTPGDSLVKLKEGLRSSELRIFPYGQRSVLIVDMRMPFLQEIRSQTLLAGLLARSVSAEGEVDLKRLSPAERSEVAAYLGKYFPDRNLRVIAEGEGRLAVLSTRRVTLDDGVRKVEVSLDESDRTKLGQSLSRYPISPVAAPSEARRAVSDAVASSQNGEVLSLRFFGGSKRNFGDVMDNASTILKEVMDELEGARAAEAWNLQKALTAIADKLPMAGAAAELSEVQKSQLHDRLQMECRANNMTNEEADAFARRLVSFSSRRSFSLAFCAGKGANGVPVMYSIEIGSFSGNGKP